MKTRSTCPTCARPTADKADEAWHNTGERGCATSRKLCWRMWHANEECTEKSVYDVGEGALWCLGDVGLEVEMEERS